MDMEQDGYLLIVEDDPDILRLLETTLKFRGYPVVTASNGKEALETIQENRPTIIITDIMMPQLDGFGLVHRLRLNPETRTIPVVFITATFVTYEDKEFSLNIGATRFIQKPLDMEKFLKTIVELLNQESRVAAEPLNEFNFYNGYRKRLEAKLEQKNKQILRDERLLATEVGEKDQAIRASLRQAVNDQEELMILLDQTKKQLEKLKKVE